MELKDYLLLLDFKKKIINLVLMIMDIIWVKMIMIIHYKLIVTYKMDFQVKVLQIYKMLINLNVIIKIIVSFH